MGGSGGLNGGDAGVGSDHVMIGAEKPDGICAWVEGDCCKLQD